ncbi:MAG TPA: hypothetical protein VGQ76_02475 [Thermoanaerobaculia bacterium]|jgi:hypothetical protein|nr:hypothetical protein [Thermoanaerobaculia bacterium]
MIRVADIALFDEFGQILLLAEVRTPESPTTPEWAATVRSDIARRMKGFVPRYFLVVARDNSYLWISSAAPDAIPDVQIATEELLSDYLRRAETTAATIVGSALELLVGFWLQDLTYGKQRANHSLPENIDLAAAAENGRIEFAAAA